jgi:hypothetical protein
MTNATAPDRPASGMETGLNYGVAFCLPFLGLLAWAMVWMVQDDRREEAARLLLMLLPLTVLVAAGGWWGMHASRQRAAGWIMAVALQGLIVLLAFVVAGQLFLYLDGQGWTSLAGGDFWLLPVLWLFFASLCLALGLAIRRHLRRRP